MLERREGGKELEGRGGIGGKGRNWREGEELEGRGGIGGKGRNWREGEELEEGLCCFQLHFEGSVC